MEAEVIAALIGAAATAALFFGRDILLANRRKNAADDAEKAKTKLEKIYSPLVAVMGQRKAGDAGTLEVLRTDPILRQNVKEQLHLLSDELRDIVTEFQTMGKWDGSSQGYTASEMQRINALSKSFREKLLQEYEELRKK